MTDLTYEKEYEFYNKFSPYVMEDFKNMKQGDIHIMHYNCYNVGSFIYIHEKVDEEYAIGRFYDVGDNIIDDRNEIQLYEYSGFICVGSGAEPVCRVKPNRSCYE